MYDVDPRDVTGRLRRVLLAAFAEDVDVEGNWLLTTDDDMLPDIAVAVRHRANGRSAAERGRSEAGGSDAFVASLREVIFEAYGEGVDPSGTHRIEYPSAAVPDWVVTVRLDPFEDESGRPSFCDERG